MMRLTLRIVSEVLLGTRTDRDAADIGQAVDGAQRYIEALQAQLVRIPRFVPTPRNLAFKRSLVTLDRVAYSIIDERRRSGESGTDVVSMLLEARYEDGRPLSRARIRNELVTLLAAGHETTSNALSWTLMRLSMHPDIARRLVAEVDDVLGDRPPTFDDLPKLVLTRRVFDEAMRLHPPVWLTGRLAKEEHELGGHRDAARHPRAPEPLRHPSPPGSSGTTRRASTPTAGKRCRRGARSRPSPSIPSAAASGSASARPSPTSRPPWSWPSSPSAFACSSSPAAPSSPRRKSPSASAPACGWTPSPASARRASAHRHRRDQRRLRLSAGRCRSTATAFVACRCCL